MVSSEKTNATHLHESLRKKMVMEKWSEAQIKKCITRRLGCSSVVEHLPSKLHALDLILSTLKKKKV